MTKAINPRSRKVRVLATLGPASNTPEMIALLQAAGADAFRINMSHGDQAAKAELVETIRALEAEQNFGPAFIDLARAVYITNDRRSAIKRQINERHGSEIIEVKGYRPYA